MKTRFIASCVALSMLGCAPIRPKKARAELDELVEDRTGVDGAVAEARDEQSRARVQARVDELLSAPLSEDSAVRIALLNNRGFHAELEELGIAQADLVEAGLLENPVVGGHVIISTRGNGIGGGASLGMSLLSVLLIPAKRRVAKRRLKQTVVRLGSETMHLIKETKVAYYRAVAAEQELDLHRGMAQAAEVADDLSRRQLEAGNVVEIERQEAAAELDEARLHLAEAELEHLEAREELNRLLGLWGGRLDWKLAGDRPEIPEQEAELGDLVAKGVRDRLDLSAARHEVEALEYALKLRRRGVIPNIEVGAEAGNEVGDDEGHEWVVGPSLSIEVPIFNPGHADFARMRAMLRQAQHRLQADAVAVRSDIRLKRAELLTARRKAIYYRDTIIPRTQKVAELTLHQYNGMLIGAHEVFEAKAEQYEIEGEYAEAIADYWSARAELELATGGDLPAGVSP